MSIYPHQSEKKKRWGEIVEAKDRMRIQNSSYAEAAAGYHAHYPIKRC